jgi:hypothetical protein
MKGMKLTKLAKDWGSGKDGCETMYLAENGMFAVQGPEVDAATWATIENPLPGETAVFIKPEIVAEAFEKYLAARR